MNNQIQSFDPDFDEDDDQDLDAGPLKVEFDLPALLLAWQDDSPDNRYYLDTTSGAVKLVNANLFRFERIDR